MGAGQSAKFEHQEDYLVVCFDWGDRLLAFHGDQKTTDVVRTNVERWAPNGVSSVKTWPGGMEIKLNEDPVWGKEPQCRSIIQMICHIIEELKEQEWIVQLTSVQASSDRTSAIYFRRLKQEKGTVSCLSFNPWDKLFVLNGNEKLKMVLRNSLEKHLLEAEDLDPKWVQIKLKDEPWVDSLEETKWASSRKLTIDLIENCYINGFRICANFMAGHRGDNLYLTEDLSLLSDNSRFFILSLIGSDRVRLLNVDTSCLETVKDVVGHWYLGVAKITIQSAWTEFKLNGSPWASSGEERSNALLLLVNLLKRLQENGRQVYVTLDSSHRSTETGTLLLKSCHPTSVAHLCLSAEESNLLKIVNAPEHLTNALTEIIKRNWKGIAGQKMVHGVKQIALKGTPWSDCRESKHLMTKILAKVQAMGWEVAAAVNTTATTEHGWLADTWFLRYVKIT